MSIQQYLDWKDEKGNHFVPVTLEGSALIRDRILNKGTGFTLEERKNLGLEGLLPAHISNLDEQLARAYEGYCTRNNPLTKYLFLRSLQDRNETLFYALVSRHVKEMMPIIYTPTVGLACQQFSHMFTDARGLYITQDNIDNMDEMPQHFPSRNIRVIVVTDNQGILGIGDQGVGGMGIPIGKLSLYVLAGIHPASCLPITLDVGTDNEMLLNDPLYLGLRQKRLTGKEYTNFIEKFAHHIKNNFPNAVLQWEDFRKENAFANLEQYRNLLPSFNDDIQGTGAVTLAGILGAMKIKKEKLTDQTFCIFGAGAGGIGVTRQIHIALVKEGLSPEEAYNKIFVIGSRGLEMADREGLEAYKRPFAKKRTLVSTWRLDNPNQIQILDVIRNANVTVLLGLAGQGGAFTKEIAQEMMNNSDRPVIFPLSNPTAQAEATPNDLFEWTKGKSLIATGSPFPDVEYEGQTYPIGQGNNVFIFPGVGLATVIGKIRNISDELITTAAYALADYVERELHNAIFPDVSVLNEISVVVATAILEKYAETEEGKALKGQDLKELVQSQQWHPHYLPYKRVY